MKFYRKRCGQNGEICRLAIPRKQRSTKVRQKTFTTHLLLSDENLAKICNADKQVKKTQKFKERKCIENCISRWKKEKEMYNQKGL